MASKRYDTPNHPRWDARTTETRSTDPPSRWQSGRARAERPASDAATGSDTPPALVTRAETDDAPVELSDGPNWTRITAELPDRSLDDVRITAAGTAIRIRAASPASSDRSDGIDRTIALSGAADADGAVVAYCDPVLSVLVPKRDAA
ncbi:MULTISPECIES: hypothetical protein [Halorussus]|uniref:hypothetical protein n=1 Tax=Halorussus TaxID=1070314 RepID=UPI000E211D92|nr:MULTISPECIES: hypothetical protein [Halorussus]NHN61604.1 hypothetical protein [Halorussus sp. JP-T4]